MDGVIVVDKPAGWTSHDVVAKLRRLAGTRKIGHLGTLDPLATGVLPLVLNGATRLSQFYLKADKGYDAVIRFGWTTDSYDSDGEATSDPIEPNLSRAQVEQELDNFRGTQMQTPPSVSAKKIRGVPAYKLARKHAPVFLKDVEVTVHELELLEFEPERIRIRVLCTGGTYLRSIAHDLGKKLGCGGFVEQLRRTSSGDFRIAQARTIAELELLSVEQRIGEALIPASLLLTEFPDEVVDDLTARQIRQGRDFRVSPFRVQRGAQFVKAIAPDGSLLAIGEVRLPNLYHPILVL